MFVKQMVVDLRSRDHLSLATDQQLDQPIFARCKLHQTPLAIDFPGGRLHDNVSHGQIGGRLMVAATNQRTQAGLHFGQIERLDQIIVGP